MVTDQQVRRLFMLNEKEKSRTISAAKAGMDPKTARKYLKIGKLPCKALKGKGAASGIRIIYAHFEKENIIEFIEIYYKGNKENEDRERILKHYSKER